LQQHAAVLDFAPEDALGGPEAIAQDDFLLVTGELTVAAFDGQGAAVAITEPGEVGDRNLAIEAGADRLGGDLRLPKNQHLFEGG